MMMMMMNNCTINASFIIHVLVICVITVICIRNMIVGNVGNEKLVKIGDGTIHRIVSNIAILNA